MVGVPKAGALPENRLGAVVVAVTLPPNGEVIFEPKPAEAVVTVPKVGAEVPAAPKPDPKAGAAVVVGAPKTGGVAVPNAGAVVAGAPNIGAVVVIAPKPGAPKMLLEDVVVDGVVVKSEGAVAFAAPNAGIRAGAAVVAAAVVTAPPKELCPNGDADETELKMLVVFVNPKLVVDAALVVKLKGFAVVTAAPPNGAETVVVANRFLETSLVVVVTTPNANGLAGACETAVVGLKLNDGVVLVLAAPNANGDDVVAAGPNGDTTAVEFGAAVETLNGVELGIEKAGTFKLLGGSWSFFIAATTNGVVVLTAGILNASGVDVVVTLGASFAVAGGETASNLNPPTFGGVVAAADTKEVGVITDVGTFPNEKVGVVGATDKAEVVVGAGKAKEVVTGDETALTVVVLLLKANSGDVVAALIS